MQIRVLILDADIQFAVRVREALQATGDYEVNTFATAQAALEELARQRYDVAVVDFHLPGEMLVEALRDAQPNMPLILTYDEAHSPPPPGSARSKLTKPYRARDLIPHLQRAAQENQETPETLHTPGKAQPSRQPLAFEDLFESGEGINDDAEEDLPRQDRGRTRPLSPKELETPYEPCAEEASEAPPEERPGKRPLYETVLGETEEFAQEDQEEKEEEETQPPAVNIHDLPSTKPSEEYTSFQAVMKRIAARTQETSEPVEEEPPSPPKDEEMPDWLAQEAPIVSELTKADGIFMEPGTLPDWLEEELPLEAPPTAPPTDPIDEAERAELALTLTHLAVQTSAEVMLVTRNRNVLAYAGEIQQGEALDLAAVVHKHWTGSGLQTQVQFVRLDSMAKDYILYSLMTADDMLLSLAFPTNMPLGQVRRQAKEIGRALEQAPAEEETQAPAPTTPIESPEKPAGSTDSVVFSQQETIPSTPPPTPEPAPEPEAEPTQMVSYACAWTLREAGARLTEEQKDHIAQWLAEIADMHHWHIQDFDTQPTYISVQLDVSVAEQPAHVVEALMDALSNRLVVAYPEEFDGVPEQSVWADGYYVVTPARRLEEREISRFIDYQRREQQAVP